jgi:hypothetical protein
VTPSRGPEGLDASATAGLDAGSLTVFMLSTIFSW